MDQPVIPFDMQRMFLGDAPPLFLLEIVFRCVVIYAWTLVLLRWIGGRSVTQLSLVEFLMVIALGSAVGDSLFYPDVPLVHAMLAILVIVVINKAIDWAILRWDLAKRIVDGAPIQLMEDGRILTNRLSHRTMGQAELSSALRAAGVRNFGEVEAVYLEGNGKISIFRRGRPQPGLRIAPPHELDPPAKAEGAGGLCCEACGLVLAADAMPGDGCCPKCGASDWTRPELQR